MAVRRYLRNEEDVRAKLVTSWLADHGFGPTDFILEYSFEIQLGHNVFRVESGRLRDVSRRRQAAVTLSPRIARARADVLVRSSDGRNLLIVEVKAPSEPLTNEARDQGISYARLLHHGGIAPFVVLTNGQETHVYDSVTGDLLNGTHVPLDHPSVRAGFRVTGPDSLLRAQALELLVSLDPENLLEFCRAQALDRMQPLRSDDPQSGKKYIPSLYVERAHPKATLRDRLDDEERTVVLLVGEPQVGKTNFICHLVEERLGAGKPTLFYPAIGMRRGLLQEIADDFDWVLGETASPHHIICRKLSHILQDTGQKLVIFIDGWNEAALDVARAIDRDCGRLCSAQIQVVVSMTQLAATRLLRDDAGNPSRIADAAFIPAKGVALLEVSPQQVPPQWSVVYLDRYNDEEVAQAYSKYASVYHVRVPERHRRIKDPFLLRIGMEQLQGGTLPVAFDEPAVLAESIQAKAARAVDLKAYSVPTLLKIVAERLLETDEPIPQEQALQCWGLPSVATPPPGLFEAALLAQVHNAHTGGALDYYYTRERDFVVACWIRKWPTKFEEDDETVVRETEHATRTQVGTQALRWFLSQPRHRNHTKRALALWSQYQSALARRVLLGSLRQSITDLNSACPRWVRTAMYEGVRDPDKLVKAEAVKLMALLTDDDEELAEVLLVDEEFIASILLIEDEHPLGLDTIGRVVLDALQRLDKSHDWYGSEPPSHLSALCRLLRSLMEHPHPTVRKGAAKSLAYVAPNSFLGDLAILIARPEDRCTRCGAPFDMHVTEYADAVDLAADQIHREFFPEMCPGYYDHLLGEPNEVREVYIRMHNLWAPVIARFWPKHGTDQLLDLLRGLEAISASREPQGSDLPNSGEILAHRGDVLARRWQLKLPFPAPL